MCRDKRPCEYTVSSAQLKKNLRDHQHIRCGGNAVDRETEEMTRSLETIQN